MAASKSLLLLRVCQLDDERSGKEVLARDVAVLGNLVTASVYASSLFRKRTDFTSSRASIWARRFFTVGITGRVGGRNVLVEEDLALHPVEIDIARLVGQPHDQQTAAEQTDGMAVVRIIATVMVTLRRRPVTTSLTRNPARI